MSNALFGSDGSTYNQSAVITPDYKLNQTALEEIGLPRYTTTYAISQLAYNLSLGAAVTYIFLWHWKELKTGALTSLLPTVCRAETESTAFGSLRFLRSGHAEDIDDPHYKGT